MRKTLVALFQFSAVTFAAGLVVGAANGQGINTGMGGYNTGTGQFSSGSTGGSTGGRSSTGGSSGSSSSSLFNSGSGGSSSSLFNSGSSSSGSTGSSGSGGSGSSGAGTGTGNAETTIQTGKLGSGTPITRGAALERNTSGAYLINSNADVIGGQPGTGNNNQFSNLFSQIGRQLNQGGNFNQQGGRNTARSTIRIPLRTDLMPKPAATSSPQFVAKYTTKFENRLAKLPALNVVGPIRVTMEGSTAVLKGVVASEQDRELAAGVAMLEPEVETVRNELTVQAAAGDAADPSSP